MTNKILADMEFASIISEAYANTQTGAELLNKYKAHVMANESSCALVNNFVKEASKCIYDNGVNEAFTTVTDIINNNKTVWALASACESIKSNNSSYNYINLNAAKQVEKLLEMDENDVVKYIKAGALKNVMFCESFRNIVKQVYKDSPMIEATADYTKITPVSMVENVGDGVCFEIAGNLYKMTDDKEIMEAQWNEVSNTFKTISSLLESNMVTIDSHDIIINTQNAKYTISKGGEVVREGKEGKKTMTVSEMRDHNRLVIMSTNARYKNNMAQILEAIALTCENYDSIVNMDNASIYTTKNDKFIVIEAGTNIYSTLLASTKHPKWTVNENAIDAFSFIKNKTNVSLSENYKELIEDTMAKIDEGEKERIENELKMQKQQSYRERIEALTEKFKNDPVKLAVLSKLAQEISSIC